MKLIHIGNECFVNVERITAVTPYTSAPIRRKVKSAKEEEKFIDMTSGRKMLSIIHMEDGVLVGVPLLPKTLVNKISAELLLSR